MYCNCSIVQRRWHKVRRSWVSSHMPHLFSFPGCYCKVHRLTTQFRYTIHTIHKITRSANETWNLGDAHADSFLSKLSPLSSRYDTCASILGASRLQCRIQLRSFPPISLSLCLFFSAVPYSAVRLLFCLAWVENCLYTCILFIHFVFLSAEVIFIRNRIRQIQIVLAYRKSISC